MPNLIDGTFASDLKAAMLEVTSTMDTVKQALLKEVRGMADDVVANGQASVQKIKDQRQTARDMFTDILGNEVAGSSEGER